MKVLIIIPTENKVEAWCKMGIESQTVKDFEVMVNTTQYLKIDDDIHKDKYLNIVRNRNIARQKALDTDAEWFLWVDSDVAIPPHALEFFLTRDLDLMGGWYKLVFEKRWVGGVWKKDANDKAILTYFNYPPEGPTPVDMLGLGCVMMKRHVLEKIKFDARTDKYLTDELGKNCFWGDCLSFSMDAKSMGIQPIMLGGVVCEHILRV